MYFHRQTPGRSTPTVPVSDDAVGADATATAGADSDVESLDEAPKRKRLEPGVTLDTEGDPDVGDMVSRRLATDILWYEAQTRTRNQWGPVAEV